MDRLNESLRDRIESYSIKQDHLQLVADTPLLLIAGVVGGGKNTVINEILTQHDRYREIISHTTRRPRNNHGELEREGVHYHFIDVAEAERMVSGNEFIEVKAVHDSIYGTSTRELELVKESQKIGIADVDIQGVMEYLDIKPNTYAIFLLPPSVETWLKRLERRYGDLEQHKEDIKERFKSAQKEIRHIDQDKRFIVVINDDLDTTVERITQIVEGERDETSEYASTIVEHLLEYIGRYLSKN